MNTKQCPHCYSTIDARATVCPNCSRSIKQASGTWQLGTLLMALGLLILIGGVFSSGLIVVIGLVLMGVGAVMRLAA